MAKNDPNQLRSQLDGSAILKRWMQITYWLYIGHKPVFECPVGAMENIRTEDFKVTHWEPLTSADIVRLEKVLSSLQRLVNKLLPELKSVDIADAREQRVPMTSAEKAIRLYNAIRLLPNGDQLLANMKGPTAPASLDPGLDPASAMTYMNGPTREQ